MARLDKQIIKMKQFKFDYDEENDDLFIYLENSKSEGAIEIGNFIIDFDKDENFVSIEIIDASKILSKLMAKIIELNKIIKLESEIVNFRNMASIKLKITLNTGVETTNIIIPTVKEVSPSLNY